MLSREHVLGIHLKLGVEVRWAPRTVTLASSKGKSQGFRLTGLSHISGMSGSADLPLYPCGGQKYFFCLSADTRPPNQGPHDHFQQHCLSLMRVGPLGIAAQDQGRAESENMDVDLHLHQLQGWRPRRCSPLDKEGLLMTWEAGPAREECFH